MKKAIYRTLNYIFFLFVGVGLLWLVLKGQDLNQIWQDLKNAKYSWIFISLIFAIISFINRSIRWNLLINSMDYKPKLQYTFTALLTGYFANLAIPRIGEVTRCGILSKKQNIPFDLLLGTVIAERLFDFICLVIIIFITILCQLSFLSNFINQHIILPFTNNIHSKVNSLWLIGFSLIALFILYLLYKLLRRFIIKSRFYPSLKNFINGTIKGFKTIRNVKKPWLFVFHTVMLWFMYYLMTYVCFFAFTQTAGLKPIDGLTILVIGSLGIVVPVPGGIGTYHYLVKLALVEIFLIGQDVSTTFPILTHASQTFTVILLGLISLLYIFLKKNKNYDKN